MRDDLEANIANKLDVPIIKIIIGTDSDKLFSVRTAVKKNIPCLFIEVKTVSKIYLVSFLFFQGTGTLGDIQKDLLNLQKELKENNADIEEKIKEMVILKWKLTKDDDIKRCVDCIGEIVTDVKDLSNIFFSYSLKDSVSCSFDTAIYKTLIQFNKNRSIGEKIEMTVEWNRFDIAQKELFNDKINWVSFIFFDFSQTLSKFSKL